MKAAQSKRVTNNPREVHISVVEKAFYCAWGIFVILLFGITHV